MRGRLSGPLVVGFQRSFEAMLIGFGLSNRLTLVIIKCRRSSAITLGASSLAFAENQPFFCSRMLSRMTVCVSRRFVSFSR